MITRREFVAIACATAYGAVPGSAFATQAAVDEAMRALTGGAQVRRGRVKLDAPALIENGNSVVLGVSVESPMTQADHVKAIHVFAPMNPLPNMVSVHLGPRDIIRQLVCSYNGAEVFRADFHPAIAANPLISFTTVATESGRIEFRWTGDNDFSAIESAPITVE